MRAKDMYELRLGRRLRKRLAKKQGGKHKRPHSCSVLPKLFDDIVRTDASPKKNNETFFDFYNRSSRPEIDKVRKFLKRLTASYPRHEVNELCTRIRSGDNTHFKSATFELFIHGILSRSGCTLIPHPELPNGLSSKPDFLVKTANKEEFYLEAALVSEANERNEGAEARKGLVFDTLSDNPHPNFKILVEQEGNPTSQPSGKKLVKKVHRWLDSLNPDVISEQIDTCGLDSIPSLQWNHEEWYLLLKPIPISKEHRGTSKNLIGMRNLGCGAVDAWTPIRDKVKLKGSKYGKLNKPLIIAINHDSFNLNIIDEMQALYGQEQLVINHNQPNTKPRRCRKPNGTWIGKHGPQYTRVSAVWLFNNLEASSVATRTHTIHFNPMATYPVPESLKEMPHTVNDQGQLIEGASLKSIFELDDNWPE